MNEQKRFIKFLMRKGVTVVASIITGDVCPCMSNNRNNYSAQWHADNPLAEDCNKTGVINSTTTATNIKAMFIKGVQSLSSFLTKEQISVVGEIQKDEMFMLGQCNTSGTFYDVSSFVERRDYITVDSVDYLIRENTNIDYQNNIGQISILKRIES